MLVSHATGVPVILSTILLSTWYLSSSEIFKHMDKMVIFFCNLWSCMVSQYIDNYFITPTDFGIAPDCHLLNYEINHSRLNESQNYTDHLVLCKTRWTSNRSSQHKQSVVFYFNSKNVASTKYGKTAVKPFLTFTSYKLAKMGVNLGCVNIISGCECTQKEKQLEKVALDGNVECCAPPPRWCDLELWPFDPKT